MLNPNDRRRLNESENSSITTDSDEEDASIFSVVYSPQNPCYAATGGIEPIKGEEFMEAFSTHAE